MEATSWCASKLEENLTTPLSTVLESIQTRMMKGQNTYFGITTIKCPLDFWVYREIILETNVDVVIEIGNWCGGSALAFAHIMDNRAADRGGIVIAVDIDHADISELAKKHPRIKLIEKDAISALESVRALIKPTDRVMVIEDSAHTYENTLSVLKNYAPLVTRNNYFIVEDTICHHGLSEGPAPGPYEAVQDFLRGNQDFAVDQNREPYLIIWNPNGFLVRR